MRKGNGLPDLLARLEKPPASLLNFGPFVMVLMRVLAIILLPWKWSLDAKAIVDAITNPNYTSVFVSSLMDDCRMLVSQIPQICIRHCYREANRCANALARMGGSQASDFVFLAGPSVDLVQLLDFDFHGLYLNRYFGILNGIDTAMWNPATDIFLPAKFNAQNPEGKKLCKYYVQRGLGLASDGFLDGNHVPDMAHKVPLVVCITRLVPQKGLHLISHAIKRVEELGAQMVILGKTSDGRVEREFEGLAKLHNQGPSIRILLMFSEELSHMLYAAADVVLVPSMFEPCGLAQMIGMRYGAVPVVRKTGGLADTVFDLDDQSNHEMANGFVFEGIDEGSLDSALDRALAHYRQKPDEWNGIVQKVMELDNSWNNTAGKYIGVYNSVRVRL